LTYPSGRTRTPPDDMIVSMMSAAGLPVAWRSNSSKP